MYLELNMLRFAENLMRLLNYRYSQSAGSYEELDGNAEYSDSQTPN